MGFIGRAVVGEEAFDFDAVEGVEGDGLVECVDHGGDFFVIIDAGKSESGVVVDGDVERFVASAFVAIGSVAGGAYAWMMEAA